MRLLRPLLACLALTCALVVAVVPVAGAATHVLRPQGGAADGAWVADPAGALQPEVLDDPVLAPAAPPTPGDAIFSDVRGGWTWVGFATHALVGTERVVSTRMSTYASSGSNQSLRIELWTGFTFLAGVTVPANSPAAWRTMATAAQLTQAQLDGMYLYVSLSGKNVSTAARVYAAYVELETDIPPAPPALVDAPAAADDDATPTWSWTSGPQTTTECELVRGATVVQPWGPCPSPRTFDLTMQPDGAYTFSVRARDAGGLASDATVGAYTLDRTAPVAPTFTAEPAPVSGDATPSWSFAGEPDATFECELTRGATVVSALAPCSTPAAHDLSARPDGAYQLAVRAIDAAGNHGPFATSSVTLDRSVPGTPAVSVAPASPGKVRGPAFSFSAAGAATYECRLSRGATELAAWAACSSPHTANLSAAPDGTYTLAVRGVSAASTRGPESERDYVLDTAAPLPPAIDSEPPPASADATPTWSFTAEPGSQTQCQVVEGARVVVAWSTCTSPATFSLAAQPDGDYTFSVRATDAATNVGSESISTVTLDRTVPPQPAIDSEPASPGRGRTPSWTFSGTGSASFECRLERPDGTAVGGGWSAGCASPAGYDLAGQPDGTYTFAVRGVSGTGVAGPPATGAYVLDTAGPGAPAIVARPASPTRVATPSWSFTGDPAATFECRLERGATLVADWSGCPSPETFDLGSQPDGDYRFGVRAVDQAGNAGPDVTDDVTLDRSGPDAAVTGGPPAASNDATPTWTFTAEAGATFACRVERGAAVVADWAACSSPRTYDHSGGPDADYTFRVRATDAAGNTGAVDSRSYTLDRSVPGPASIVARPASPSADATPEWTLSGDPGMTLECRLTRGGAVVFDWAACPGPPATYDLSSRGDGTYTLHVRQRNAAATRGPEVSDQYLLDAAPPPAPAITATPGPIGNGSAPAWSFVAEAGATAECRLRRGGEDVRAWAPCASPRGFDLSGEPDGDYELSVRAVDGDGTVGAVASDVHRLDRMPPAPPELAGGPGPLGSLRTPAWSFAGEPGAVFECALERPGGAVEGWGPCDSPRGYDLAGHADGPFSFGVRARDAAGNTSGATAATYELDTTPGAVRIESGPAPVGRDRAPAWRFSAEEGAAFECRLSPRAGTAAGWGPCASPATFDLTGRPDGVFAFAVRATDRAGNLGPVGEAGYELDTTAPAAPSFERRPTSPGTDRTPSWAFSGEAGAAFSCRVERRPFTTLVEWTPCASPYTADLATGEEGDFRFLVRATDRAGNVGTRASDDYALTTARDGDGDGGEKGRTGDVPPEGPPGGGDAPPAPEAPAAGDPAPAPVDPGADEPGDPRREGAAEPRREAAGPDAAGASERAAGAAEPPPAPSEKPAGKDGGGNVATRAVSDAVRAIVGNPDKSVFPLSLLFLVLGFLAVQNRLDRNDPKLALAPTFADPDLEFRPTPGDPQ